VNVGGLLLVIAVLVVVWIGLAIFVWVRRPAGMTAGDVLRLIPDIVRLVRAIVTDPQTPRSVRWANVGLLVWLISPIDLIPEFLPVFGSLDDVVVAVMVLRWTLRRIGPAEVERHWSGSPAGLALLRSILGQGSV
jgi:uncharacterized membrane protein YkvA (DUF1232 family)